MPSTYRIAVAEYSFARDGGAVGLRTLGINDAMPPNSQITRLSIDVLTPLTSAGAALVSLGLQATDDVLEGLDLATFNGILFQSNQNSGTKLAVAQRLKFTVADFALTAGRFRAYTFYVVSSA